MILIAGAESVEVVQRLMKLEDELMSSMREIRSQLALNGMVLQFFGDGLQAYRERCFRDAHADGRGPIIEKVRDDRELRFPHRKIVDVLINQYDFIRREFSELHFSKLVREARVGKNRAKAYLQLLEAKGYVERRDSGYRIFFRIKD